MTREEANLTIDYLKEMQESYIEGEGYERHPLPEWYALDKAIEVLEQESFINKSCISSGVCKHDKNEVLNKIRAEIMKFQLYKMFEGEDTFYIERDNVLQIIDKYKAESEG